jgi:phosphopantetheinyl transferase
MPLPKTVVVQPQWVTVQTPSLWLTPSERDVYAAWASEERKSEWLAGRLAAKKLLREELGLPPLDWQVGRDGVAPAIIGRDLPSLTLSLSHSAGMGAATLSDTHAEGSAGIDVQRVRPVHPGLCARVFTPEERQQIAAQFGSEDSPDGMLLLWALKEAAIKARRQVWGRPLQNICVRLGHPGFAEIDTEGEPVFPAQYERLGNWWLARAVRPVDESVSDQETFREVALTSRNSSCGSRR